MNDGGDHVVAGGFLAGGLQTGGRLKFFLSVRRAEPQKPLGLSVEVRRHP